VDVLIKNNIGFEILTDTGWSKFDGLIDKGEKSIALLQLESTSIKATLNHDVYTNKLIKKSVGQLKPGNKIYTTTGLQSVVSVRLLAKESVYDLLNVEHNRRFYANNILCSNCEFLIADETLIAPAKLIDLQGREPLYKTGEVRWYKKPQADRIYAVGLDPSLGTGGDPAAIQVFEANSTEQVAEWRHNRTDIPTQIRIMADIIRHINDEVKDPKSIYYSVENNSIGEAALISIQEYGEEKIQGYFLSESGKNRKGFNTSNKPKLAACAKFKHLVESRRMTINSASLVTELKNFVAHGVGYAAKPGETDDLIMAALLVVRMLQVLQSYHTDLDSHMRDHQDSIIEPLPFVMLT
jgi:intein/homing endonuclease